MKNRDEINQHEALNYFPGWSEQTRGYVRGEIARMGASRFRVNSHGFWNSVQVLDAGGTFLADLMKTKVWYVPEAAPAGAEDEGSKNGLLSVMLEGVTRANRSERTVRPEPRNAPTCPRCQIAHAGDECY